MQVYSDLSDAELFDLVQDNDHLAYTEIYDRYTRLLYTHAYKKLGDRELSRDMVQDLFTHLWLKREHIQIQGTPAIYLYTALRNKILDHHARQQLASGYVAYLEHFSFAENHQSDHLIRQKQLATLIEQEIAALPSKMRHVFELSRNCHLSHKEIAEELGISEQTVRKQVQNALKIMRQKLGLMLYLAVLLEI